jgi:hypothetical protein
MVLFLIHVTVLGPIGKILSETHFSQIVRLLMDSFARKMQTLFKNLFDSINLLENYYGSDSKIFLDHLLKVH